MELCKNYFYKHRSFLPSIMLNMSFDDFGRTYFQMVADMFAAYLFLIKINYSQTISGLAMHTFSRFSFN